MASKKKEKKIEETTNIDDTPTIEYDKAPFSKRFVAALLDGVMFITVAVILHVYAFSYALMATPAYKDAAISFANRKAESHLYLILDDNTVPLLTDHLNDQVKKEELTRAQANTKANDEITVFYYLDEFKEYSGGIDTYNHLKIPEGKTRGDYFIRNAANEIVQDPNKTDDEMAVFYNDIAMPASLSYLYKDSILINTSKTITWFSVASIAISVTISSLLVYMMFPLIFKTNRQTLGKKIFKLGVIANNGFRPTFWRAMWRYAIIYFVETVLSVAFLIPLIVSFSMLVFSKSGVALHDYLSATYVVDVSQKTIYKNIDEYRKTTRELADFDVDYRDVAYKK